jgi:hypothetical protein
VGGTKPRTSIAEGSTGGALDCCCLWCVAAAVLLDRFLFSSV